MKDVREKARARVQACASTLVARLCICSCRIAHNKGNADTDRCHQSVHLSVLTEIVSLKLGPPGLATIRFLNRVGHTCSEHVYACVPSYQVSAHVYACTLAARLCVCACVRACVRVCVCLRVCVGLHTG